MTRALCLILLLLISASPTLAIREGTATAALFIQRYTHTGNLGKAALWHDAAATCLKKISVPMNHIAYDYYKQHGYHKWTARAEKEVREIQAAYRYHRTHAEKARQKSDAPIAELESEKQKIAQFMATWLPRYPNRFYEFGIYPTFFLQQQTVAAEDGDYARVLQLEADAAEMCAAQYEKVPIAAGLSEYEKIRDAYLRYAKHLRERAHLPVAIEQAKRLLPVLKIEQQVSQETAAAVLGIAKADPGVQKILAGQKPVHADATFHGFVWIVRFSNHSRGPLAVALVDEKTATVLDVF